MSKVWLYVPNIIDYVRVVLLFTSLQYFYNNMYMTLVLYGLSKNKTINVNIDKQNEI